VLKKLPATQLNCDDLHHWSDVLVDHLKKTREEATTSIHQLHRRQKRLAIPPGKGVVVTDSDNDAGPSTANVEEEINSENGDMGDGNSFCCGEFVLVSFSTGKRNRNYIGQVIAIVNGEVEIRYLRKRGVKQIYFVFPDVPDVQITHFTQIVTKLQSKNIGRRRYVFFEY